MNPLITPRSLCTLSAAFGSFLLVCGCSSVRTVNMPLDFARLANGYVNSSNKDLGHLYVWDTVANRLATVYRVPAGTVPNATIDYGPRVARQASSVSEDTKLEITGAPNPTVAASARAQFVRSTNVTLVNFNPREYRDARYVLNSATLRPLREELAEQYTDPKYRFVFLSQVTDADELSLALKASGDVDATAGVIKAGDYKFKVSYNKQAAAVKEGMQVPMLVEPKIFQFRVDSSQSPPEYRFYDDITTNFSFQTVKGQ